MRGDEGRQYKKACIDIFPMPRHSRGEIMRLTAAEGRGGMFLKPTNRAEASLNMLWNQENPDRESCNPCSKSISRGNDLVEKVVHE